MNRRWRDDASIRGILAANALTLLLAWWQRWPLVLQLWPYWCQSLAIGWFARKRILSRASAEPSGHAAAPALGGPRWLAHFFLLHYGGFHLLYAMFLLAFTAAAIFGDAGTPGAGQLQLLDAPLVAVAAAGFWFGQRAAWRAQPDSPLTPQALMMLPYARILPMHLTLILGFVLDDRIGTLLFGILKTAADVLMHVLERRWLRGARPRRMRAG
jgi:hypothetical protein